MTLLLLGAVKLPEELFEFDFPAGLAWYNRQNPATSRAASSSSLNRGLPARMAH